MKFKDVFREMDEMFNKTIGEMDIDVGFELIV
jgi:hypothetical protein